MPGETLGDGRYRLLRPVGRGGMASVWLARDERLGRQVAVKVIADAMASDEQWLRRFEREARAAASLSHPNIVQVFDYNVQDDRPYLVMEYVPGGSLADRLAAPDGRPLDLEALARALLKALAHIHDAGITHRDVKPGNILLGRDGRTRLTDFGIAQPEDETSLTKTGLVIGTLRYLAPEVVEGGPATPQSDLYAAGVVLRAAGADEASHLATLIAELTATAPEQRPVSADAALELLDGPVSAPRATAATRLLHPTAPTRVAHTGPTLLDAVVGATRAGATWTRDRAGLAGAELRSRNISPRLVLAGLGLLLVVIALVASRAGGTPSATRAPGTRLAAPGQSAPLQQQLQALDQVVNTAAGR